MDITGRIALANVINSMGIPWGFMDILVPGEQNSSYYVPSQYYRSFRAQLKKDKGAMPVERDTSNSGLLRQFLVVTFPAWIGQFWGIKDMQRTSPTTALAPPVFLDIQSLNQVFLPDSMPLYHIMSNLSDAQVCASSYYQQNPEKCPEAQFANRFGIQSKVTATEALRTNATRPVSYSYCTMDTDCDQGFPVKNAAWTAEQMDAQLKAIGV